MNCMKDIIVQLDKIVQDSDSKLIIHKKPGLSNCQAIYDWPQGYIEFLAYSNGLSVGKYGECRIFPLEKAIELTEYERQLDDSMKCRRLARIASYYDDSIYLDYNSVEGTVYYSPEGIDEPVNMHLSFAEFLKKCLDNRFQVFWDD